LEAVHALRRHEAWAKRAVRVFDTRKEAEDNITKADLSVEERPGSSVRCESYCRVSSFCPQYTRIRAKQVGVR
jgi:hypothetical protein